MFWLFGVVSVVYGLLGFIWMRTRLDPKSGYFIHKQTVTFMLVWLFLCLTGLVGNIANTAHFVGIGTGMLYGIIAAKASMRRRTPSS